MSSLSQGEHAVDTAGKGKNEISTTSKDERLADTTAKGERDISTSSPTESQKSSFHVLANSWRQGLAGLASIIEGLIVSVVLGFSPWPESSPVTTFISQRPTVALVMGGTLVAVTFISLLILYWPKLGNVSGNSYGLHWLFSTAMPVVGYMLFAILLVVVLIRPAWCPTSICPAPQLVPITNPQGIHDDNLEIYLTAIQSASYVIPDDPARYSLGNLPTSISAVRKDSQAPYRVVLGVHSLQQGHYGMIIEEVALVVTQVPPVPSPLNVWINSPGLDYHSNPYKVIYKGQAVGTTLAATYDTSIPNGYVQLAPGEADELDIQVVSPEIARLQFQVEVTYRVTNESQLHTLMLPKVFEVVFSDVSNWHARYLKDGHLVPSV
ncbi:MAG: hypothetical protein JO202_03090 [Ktedonobacteraceae bacterium]|nr:hypothetical protein [Ktedonobacteraceae bacterium]